MLNFIKLNCGYWYLFNLVYDCLLFIGYILLSNASFYAPFFGQQDCVWCAMQIGLLSFH